MAEAFGIAGSAFGTVSLGIQLFTEITKYLDSVEGRNEDLDRAKNYARDFQSSLIALETWASRTGISDVDLERAISQGQANCAVAISDLSKMVSELKGQDPIPNSRTSKARTLMVKLTYPFKKQNLENLERHLFNTISVLRFALSVLQVKNIYVTQMSIQGIHQILGNILTRLPEPDRASFNILHLERVENVVETAVDSAVCPQGPTSTTPTPGIQSTRYQNGNFWMVNSFCVCRKSYKRRERRQWGPFILENEISFADYHSSGCPLSTQEPLKQQTKGTLRFPIPFTRSRWRTASQFSLFFTAGTGGMGFGQNLAWVQTVDGDQSPSFKISELAFIHRDDLSKEDCEVFLLSCCRRLKWCFANRRASITDVDQFGRSIVHYGTAGIILLWGKPCFSAEGLQWFSHHFLRKFSKIVQLQIPQCVAKAISSFLSRYGDSAGQDCKSPFPWGSVRGQFDLVKAFPQISNYLEFGQLSRLILMEDQDRVEDFLRRYPSSMNEINYLGQTPVHIAVQTQNATILSLVVSHADPKLLNTKDNDGFYAIDHAIDALCHSLRPGNEPGSTVCNGCEVLNVLLRSESAIFTESVRLAMQLPRYHTVPVCIGGQKNIIRSLVSRRKELKTLAQRELTPVERQDLKFCEPGILDQNAAQTQQLLEAKRCHIPARLKVYDSTESPEDSRSIYLLISHGDVAESALQSGFLMPTTLFDDLFRLLAERLNYGSRGSKDQMFLFSSYISWLVDHGGDLRSTVPTLWGRTTAAHYFMAFLGTNQKSFNVGCIVPLSPEVSSIIFEEDNIDDCRCQCSRKGCTPLTKFLAVINWLQYWVHATRVAIAIKSVLEHLEYLYDILGHAGYDLTKEYWIDNAAVRHFTFLILDLRHTCCSLHNSRRIKAFGPLSTEDCHEIEEEDSWRLELLEQLVLEFERERGNYADLKSFAQEYWAPRMKVVYQEIKSYVQTEAQRQSAEAAGVVWECYSPQVPCDDSLTVSTESEEEVSELEKALRKLDEIATDPERPSLV